MLLIDQCNSCFEIGIPWENFKILYLFIGHLLIFPKVVLANVRFRVISLQILAFRNGNYAIAVIFYRIVMRLLMY